VLDDVGVSLVSADKMWDCIEGQGIRVSCWVSFVGVARLSANRND